MKNAWHALRFHTLDHKAARLYSIVYDCLYVPSKSPQGEIEVAIFRFVINTNSSPGQQYRDCLVSVRFFSRASSIPGLIMPFNYAKVSSESSSNDDSLEQQQTYPGHDQRGRCTNMLDRIAFLRWPFTVLLLLVILVCELSILHRQPKTLEIGGELNGLIPTCKYLSHSTP